MQIIIDTLLFLLGLVLLLKGASVFTENSSRIARGMGVSDIVIGITLVAFTTSLPELSVSVMSVLRGASGIAIGNAIGSNIANIGLVLGISALLTPNIITGKGKTRQSYIMLTITLITVLFIVDGLTPIKGILLVTMLFLYIYYLTREKLLRKRKPLEILEKTNLPKSIVLCVLGGAGVIVGAEFLVTTSISFARVFNLSETVIGLTLIAIGTSLPELATSVMASIKKLEGIALGNIIGSNIFNLLMVLGLSAMAGTIIVESILLTYSLPFLLLFTVLLVVFLRVENKLGRLDGLALLLIYCVFLYLKFSIFSS